MASSEPKRKPLSDEQLLGILGASPYHQQLLSREGKRSLQQLVSTEALHGEPSVWAELEIDIDVTDL